MNSINDNEIGRLQKSNRNWRRKCQRLRKALRTQKAEIEELQHKIMSCNSEIERLQKEKDFEQYEKTRLRLLFKGEYDNNKKVKSEAIKEFQSKLKEMLIGLYKKYYRKANRTAKRDMFYQGRAEAVWECICRNDSLVKEMTENDFKE